MNRSISVLVAVGCANGVLAQAPTLEGRDKLANLLAPTANWRSEPDFGRRVELAGRALLGTPYVGWTLERNPKQEFLFHTLTGLDCVTFVETAMAMARIGKNPRPTEASFMRAIQAIRYRNGVINGYLSRLHYTTDWVEDQAKRGLLQDITRDLRGAQPHALKLSFMSSNPQLYPALRENPSLLPELRKIEEEISKRPTWFLPSAAVAEAESKLQAGDVVAFVTNTPGLDTSHVGLIAVDRNGTRRLLHASSDRKAVVLEGRLSEYMTGKSKMIGIMVARPLEGR